MHAPIPGVLVIRTCPPIRSARSVMPNSPKCPSFGPAQFSGLKPLPSSLICKTTCCGLNCSSIFARLASECLTTLVMASWPIRNRFSSTISDNVIAFARGFNFHANAGAAGNLPAAGEQRIGQIELFRSPAAQASDGVAQVHLALLHQIPRQFQVVGRVVGIFFKMARHHVQLQGDAGHGLFQSVMEFLGQAGSFGQNRAELKFRFLAGGHFNLQLGRSLRDPFLKLIVSFLQFRLGDFFFGHQRFQN